MIQKLLQKFLILTRAKQIALIVFALHFLTIFALIVHHLATYKALPKRPISVRTRPFLPTTQMTASAPIQQKTPAKPALSSKPKSPPQQTPKPKPTVKSKPAVQNKPTPSIVKTKQDPDPILQEIAESLESITAKNEISHTKAALAIPSRVEKKAEVVEESSIDATYSEELIAFLQNALDLPEYGEVRVRLEIDRFGSLRDCSILDSKSRKNAEFLKNQLPELAYPSFNDFSMADLTQTFTITFRNVETR